MARENHIAGFLVSTFFHLGIVAFAWAGMSTVQSTLKKEQIVPLKLSMFQPPPVPVVEPEPIPEPTPVIEQVQQEEPPPPPKPKPKLKPKPKPEIVHKPRVEPKPQPVPEIKTVTRPVIQVAKIPVQPAPDLALIERTENEYRAKLQAAIETQKKYPRRARRLRQQGSVLVAFKVKKDGSIKNITVTSASNSTILDKAAMETVLKISGLYPLPEELNRTEWSFSIPINYFLR
jgi:protein TonB